MTDQTIARLSTTPIVIVLSDLGGALPSTRVSAWPQRSEAVVHLTKPC